MSDFNYKRRFGDRKEGRQIRTLPAFGKLMPYIMKTRNDASNYYRDYAEITELESFIRQKRAEGYNEMGVLHIFIASYIRMLSHRPGLNRFIGGQKVFARHRIEIVMTVRRTLAAEVAETTIKVEFEPADTVFDVYRKISLAVDSVNAGEGDSGAERIAVALTKMPGLLLKFSIWLLNLLDYFGILPWGILEASPFHGSMAVSDFGSSGTTPIYHHLYNFGNLPVFLSFGARRRAVELGDDGVPVERKYIDYTVAWDERICDGQYCASSLKYLKYYLNNPQLLESPPDEVSEDIF